MVLWMTLSNQLSCSGNVFYLMLLFNLGLSFFIIDKGLDGEKHRRRIGGGALPLHALAMGGLPLLKSHPAPP